MYLERLKQYYFRLPAIVRLLLTVLIVIISFGVVIHLIEPGEFPTIFDGIWWAFVTAATVGYGDFAPVSTLGRSVGIVLMLTGAGLLTYYISAFAAETVKKEQNLIHGKTPYTGKNHLVFVGWNERTKKLMELTHQMNAHMDIVLVDRTLIRLPFQSHPLHFIHGDVTEDAVIEKANIKKAHSVVITADTTSKEQQADNYTILATLAIRGNHPTIPIISEVLSRKQAENVRRAGANTIVRPNDFMGLLFFMNFSEERKPAHLKSFWRCFINRNFAPSKFLQHASENHFPLYANPFWTKKLHPSA
ncbi:potassium channel family protein [Virgibacillus sp. 179-BFC.A HS]|uniref:Potassium channel family protein n=1 Tax=Tigheibacillus jepli TaxID=3035914 RepID=A0ABU5CG15_9BACI|nr:potassium channel family protein [Virgibacillus sp. 179-BFC.A HS]MDY0405259.1 potassium channel family protein [Virgibacillus sp. 179-BFC.A HS]